MGSRFSEITQQYATAADVRFGILLHPLQLLYIDALLSAVGSEFSEQNQVGQRIEQ